MLDLCSRKLYRQQQRRFDLGRGFPFITSFTTREPRPHQSKWWNAPPESKGELLHLSPRDTIRYLNRLKGSEEAATLPAQPTGKPLPAGALNAPQSESNRMGQGEIRDETRVGSAAKAEPPEVGRLVLCRHFGFPTEERRFQFHSTNYLFEADSSQCFYSFYRDCQSQLMFSLHFHYEDVSRQDPLLKPNHANVMEVPGSCEIRVVPKAPYNFIIKNGKLAMEIPRGQKFIQTQRGSTGKSFRSNPFLGSNKDKGYVSDLARQSTLRGHGMSNFSVRIAIVMSLLDSPVKIRENSIQFSMETEFCEFSPELEDHFEVFEHIRGFNVTIVTSANTQDETLPPWSGFLQGEGLSSLKAFASTRR